MPNHYDFLVGTFSTPALFTLRFTPPSALAIVKRHEAIGSHSWLHISKTDQRRNLYATAWTEPPSVAAYSISETGDVTLLNTARTKSRSGYICASSTHAYSAGGATGEVFLLDPTTGAYTQPHSQSQEQQKDIEPLQPLDFVADQPQRDDGSTLDFGGLRHGAHSADLSPDGQLLYIADIGRNCIWTYHITNTANRDTSPSNPHLTLASKTISPRPHDGPRHVHPHPAGRYIYCLQEHSSIVDVFELDQSTPGDPTTTSLQHIQAVPTIPADQHCQDFWADEVRTSLSPGDGPKWLYASTRGLTDATRGYVAVYELTPTGLIKDAEPLAQKQQQQNKIPSQSSVRYMFQTATSGGWANAIQPGPTVHGVEYIAMTDSQVGYVSVLLWDGREIKEVARVNLNDGGGAKVHGAATAVWL